MFFVRLLPSKLAASHTARWHEDLAGRRGLRGLTTATLLLGSMAALVDKVVSVAHPIGRTEHYAIRQYRIHDAAPQTRKTTSRDNGKGRKQYYGAKTVAGGGCYGRRPAKVPSLTAHYRKDRRAVQIEESHSSYIEPSWRIIMGARRPTAQACTT